MAALKPATLVANDTWRRAWVVTDSSHRLYEIPGAAARLHLRSPAGVKVAEASTEDGRIEIDAAAGRIDMTMPAAAMALPPGPYRFALEMTEADGTVSTLEVSTLVILPDLAFDDTPPAAAPDESAGEPEETEDDNEGAP